MTIDPQSIIYVVTDYWPWPRKVKEAKTIIYGIAPEAKKAQECLKYELAENFNDRAQFTFFQAWTTEQALEEHLKSEALNKANEDLREFLEKPTEIRRYRNIA